MKRHRRLEKRLYITFKQQVVWIISTAFAIAAALIWKDAIMQIFSNYMPEQIPTYSIYASVFFTLLAILIIWVVQIIFKE